MRIHAQIFKANDIRGKYPDHLNVSVAESIGNAVAFFLSKKYKKKKLTIFVGSDIRASSPMLKKALIEGIIKQGSDVVDVGMVTTPLFYFILSQHTHDGGVMVTASHNPASDNGFKIRGRKVATIAWDSGLREIKKLTKRKNITTAKILGRVIEKSDGARKYIAALVRKVKIGSVRVVIDASGGATTLMLPQLLEHFPDFLYKPLFFKPDGTFRFHDPNPLKQESQKFIKEELEKGGFDFGVVFDGDGDRIVFFDEFGNEVRADFITGLLAEYLLRRHPKSWVVLELNASKAVEEHIQKCGGKVIRSKVGFANVTKMMKEKRAILGGENSGHIFFKDFGYNESSMYALLQLAEIISGSPKKLSHFIRPLQKYVTGPQKNFSVKDKKVIMRALEKKYKHEGTLTKLDGLTVEGKRWWFNVRPSNTEPLLRLTMEAHTQAMYDEKQKEIVDFIESF